MILNNRQTAILYELIDTDECISYSYLCNRFVVVDKTIRNDVKKLNDYLNKYSINIVYKKSNGFVLKCNEEQRKRLMANFEYRYKDSSEIHNSYHKKDLSINYYLSRGPIKEKTLSESLHVSISLVTKMLADTRKKLKDYNLSLDSKPYEGLMINGNEINIRNYLVDSVSHMMTSDFNELFKDDVKTFNFNKEYVDNITNIFCNSILKNKINISQHGIIVIIIAIVFSIQRTNDGYCALFDDNQKELIEGFRDYSKYSRVLKDISNKCHINIDENDIYFIISYAILLSDPKETLIDTKYFSHNTSIVNRLMNEIDIYNICNSKELPILKQRLKNIVNNSLIRKELGFIEMFYNNSLRKALIGSSLSITIGIILFNKLESLLECKLGDYVLLSIAHSVYYQIRDIVRTKKLSNIAVFTPMYTDEGFTVADRIQYHCGQFINRIDVIDSYDILNKKINKYDLLVYFGDFDPINQDIKTDSLMVSYYFSNKDRNNLYDKLCLMTRFYKNCFGSLRKRDIITSDNFDGFYSAVQYARDLCKNDDSLLKQLELIPLTSLLVYQDTLNIILFTNRNELKTTKLINLKKHFKYNDQNIVRVFINIINSDGSAIKIKTIENIIRKMSEHITYNIESFDDNEDLFEYYIKDTI